MIYLTADRKMLDRINKRKEKEGSEKIEYLPNFREALAKTKPYKGNRTASKPFHYDNLSMYLYNTFDCKLAIGIEADDLLSIDQNVNELWCKDNCAYDIQTVICSRDKDLKITPGLHYGWACGKNPSYPLREIDVLGYLERNTKGKVSGGGLKFFYAQLIMGDPTDNIPGIPGRGEVFAYNLLSECTTEEELFEKVIDAYGSMELPEGLLVRDYFKEQANLLWIVQQLNDDGTPMLYIPFDER